MRHTLIFLAAFLLTAPESFCQTSKLDQSATKEVRLASTGQPVNTISLQGVDHIKSQGLIAKTETVTTGRSQMPVNIPLKAHAKTQPIESHTQSLDATTQILQANTQALQANTRALQVNTQALQTNVQAIQANAHLRSTQTQLAEVPANEADKTAVHSANNLAKTPVKETEHVNPMPAKLPAKTQIVSAGVAAKTPIKPPVPKMVMPGKAIEKSQIVATNTMAKPTAKPQIALTTTPVKPVAKPTEKTPVAVAAAPVKPIGKPVEKSMPIATNMVAPTARPVEKQLPVAHIETKPTMKQMPLASAAPAALPAKATMPMAALDNKKTTPTHVPQAKTAATGNIKASMAEIGNYSVKLNELMQLPLLDKKYDGKVHDAKHIPVASKSALREGDIITTQGFLQVVSTEDSATGNESYELQLTVRPEWGDACFLVKIPSDQLASMTTKETAENAKRFIREHLVKGRVPCQGGNIMRKPVYVAVTGQLIYNGAQASDMRAPKPVYQGKRGMHTTTAWEIGQVSRIEFVMH